MDLTKDGFTFTVLLENQCGASKHDIFFQGVFFLDVLE